MSKAQRALAHIKNTKCSLEGIHLKLNNRRKELYDNNMVLLPWAEDEHKFVCSCTELISELLIPLIPMVDNIGIVLCQLEKRFSCQSVYLAEKKRKLRRRKEQRSKTAKKRKCLKPCDEVSVDSDGSDKEEQSNK